MSQQLSEQELVRRDSLNKLRALGINPYPQALYPVNALSKEIKADFVEGKNGASSCVIDRSVPLSRKDKRKNTRNPYKEFL